MSDDELALIRATEVSFVIPVGERTARAMKAIDAVGLTDRAHFMTNQLSGGQQQRVAIARSLVTNPKIIFADEPTGNLDSASGRQVMSILQSLHREGHTIILVTHERKTAEHAQRIIHILDGKIDQDSRDFKRIIADGASFLTK